MQGKQLQGENWKETGAWLLKSKRNKGTSIVVQNSSLPEMVDVKKFVSFWAVDITSTLVEISAAHVIQLQPGWSVSTEPGMVC